MHVATLFIILCTLFKVSRSQTGIDVREGIDFTQDLIYVLVICFSTLISFAILTNILHFWYMKRMRRRLLLEVDSAAKPKKGPPAKPPGPTPKTAPPTVDAKATASKAPKPPGAAPPEATPAKPTGKDAAKAGKADAQASAAPAPAPKDPKAPAKAPAKPK